MTGPPSQFILLQAFNVLKETISEYDFTKDEHCFPIDFKCLMGHSDVFHNVLSSTFHVCKTLPKVVITFLSHHSI